MCSTVQERISTCGRNAIVKIGERTNIRPQKAIISGLIQYFEADFLWKVKILNSGKILKTFTHEQQINPLPTIHTNCRLLSQVLILW